jgi:4-azaleucine resistance transporter AzlC
VATFGASFGVLARSAGFGPIAPIVMSLTTFGGSAQFAAVAIISTGGGAVAAVTAAVLLNARYGPIGLSVAPALRDSLWRRALLAQLVVDESWAIGHRGGRIDRNLLLGAGVVMYAAWVVGTVAGVIGGDLLGDPQRLGLDAAFPALFLGLLIPQLRSRGALTAAILGGGIALTLVPFTRPGIPIIAAAAACLFWWWRRP